MACVFAAELGATAASASAPPAAEIAVVPAPAAPQAAKLQTIGEQIKAGLKSSFAFPTSDLLVRKHESAARELLAGLTVTPGLELPINSRSAGAGSTGAPLSGSPALTLGLRYQPVGYWFGQIRVAAYLEPSKRAPWNGDFIYSFGYDDYHPYTLSLVYSNYSDSRFQPAPGEPITRLSRGTIELGWKAPLPRSLANALLLDDSLTIDCRVGINASPRYDRQDGGVGDWKRWAKLGCRYPFTRKWFVDLTLFGYGNGQQPWDPDFTYAFGFADYESSHFSIQYANYSGNRFPGRRRYPNTGNFRDGGLSITWNRAF